MVRNMDLYTCQAFNADFNDSKGRNASTDVKNEITKLKAQNVEGIILILEITAEDL